MPKNEYLIRLDDACPTMNVSKWQRIEEILDKYGIKPMVGIIPHNEDPKQQIDLEDSKFWDKVHIWKSKGWAIALHGYNHCYTSDKGLGGLNPLWSRSEFSGLSFEVQKEKIRKGIEIMRDHDIDPQYFFAPSHTFDKNTLLALKAESRIRIISDTIANRPYKMDDFIIIPQLGGHCVEMKIPGIWTFCLHPSAMEEKEFKAVEVFLENHQMEFVGFSNLDFSNIKEKNLLSRILSWIYFTRRKLSGIK